MTSWDTFSANIEKQLVHKQASTLKVVLKHIEFNTSKVSKIYKKTRVSKVEIIKNIRKMITRVMTIQNGEREREEVIIKNRGRENIR